jgi:hypothetical protein
MTITEQLKQAVQQAVKESESGVVGFAERAGVDGGQLSRFLNGKRSLKLPAVDALCGHLGLTLQPTKPARRRA